MASFASVPAKGLPPKPPDRGSFPLDHFRECSDAKARYLECLKEQAMDAQAEACRRLSAAYLQCRMDSCARGPSHARARACPLTRSHHPRSR